MTDKYAVLKSDDFYIFRRPKYSYVTPSAVILEDGSELDLASNAYPFSVTKKPVNLIRRSTQNVTVGYGDLSPEEYNEKRKELAAKGRYEEDEYDNDGLVFDDLDDEYAYRKFVNDHPLRSEKRDVETEIEFEIFEMGTSSEKYIEPISNLDVKKTSFAYSLEIPAADILERFKSHFGGDFTFYQYSNKMKNLGEYRNFDVELEYDVRFKNTYESSVSGKEVFIVRRVGSLEGLIARRDATLKQVDDLAKKIKAQFNPAGEILVADLIKDLNGIRSRAVSVHSMQKTRGEKKLLLDRIDSVIHKLETES